MSFWNPFEDIETLITRKSKEIMSALTDLQAKVQANTTVVQSAATLIKGLRTALDEAIAKLNAGDDGAALQALSDQLGADDAALADAVAANTPTTDGNNTASARAAHSDAS